MGNDLSSAAAYLLSRAESLLEKRPFMVLSGAGISTTAGLPDYRGQGQLRRESPSIDSFVRDPEVRARFWSSTLLGWGRLRLAEPSKSHHLVAQLEKSGNCTGVVTQNVDGLHLIAGSNRVIEVHGNDSAVVCIRCRSTRSRESFIEVVREINVSTLEGLPEKLVIPNCSCGGLLRPQITFFGEDVSQQTQLQALQLLKESQAILILGSSLVVNTGYQLVQTAVEMELPSVLLNLGQSKGIGLVDLSLQMDIDAGMELLFGKQD